MCPHVHYTYYYGEDTEMTKVPTDGWMNKENVIHTEHTHIHIQRSITSHKKMNEIHAICINMDGVWGHYAKWKKSDIESDTIWSQGVWEKTMNSLRQYRLAVARGGGGVGVGRNGGKVVIHRDVIHSKVTTVNTVLPIWKLLRVGLVLMRREKNLCNCMVIALTRLIVVIIYNNMYNI